MFSLTLFRRRPLTLFSVAWRGMNTAPRDGSVVWLRCTYGYEPWEGRFRWGSNSPFGNSWVNADDPRRGVDCEGYLTWRPSKDQTGAVPAEPNPHQAQFDRENREFWRSARADLSRMR